MYKRQQEYAVRIEAGESTEWLTDEGYPPDNLRIKDMEYLLFRNPESFSLAHVNARGNESVMEQQPTVQALRASPELLRAVLGEFNRAAVIDGESRQLRKSPEGLFRFTVLQSHASLTTPQDGSHKTEVFAVPIHRVGQFRRH